MGVEEQDGGAMNTDEDVATQGVTPPEEPVEETAPEPAGEAEVLSEEADEPAEDAAEEPSEALEATAQLAGGARYRLDSEIGRGAMGIVYRAHDLASGADVAVKELALPAGIAEAQRAEMIQRFEREEGASRSLDSDNVVRVLDSYAEGDRRFIVMELIEGETLEALVSRGPLPVEAAVEVTEQVLRALAAAHGAGIVHRDLKPANIFICTDGTVKVSDFGVAHLDDAPGGLTQAGQVLGTLGYMSPEQVRGVAVDARSDVFAVGVMFYEMLIGTNPFGADQPTTLMYRIAYEEPPAVDPFVPGIPLHLNAVLTKALAKDTALRYQSAADMLGDLEGGVAPDISAITAAAVARAVAEASKPSEVAVAAPGAPKRNLFAGLTGAGRGKILAIIAAAIVLVALIAGGVVYAQQRAAEERRQAAIKSGAQVAAAVDRVKALRRRFDEAVASVRSKAADNSKALDAWDKSWKKKLDKYQTRYDAVTAHNNNEDSKYAASYYSYYNYYWGYSSGYSYTKQYWTYPDYPTPPAKVKADLGDEVSMFEQLSAAIATAKSDLAASGMTAGAFPVVAAKLDTALAELDGATSAAVSAVSDAIVMNSDKGAVINQASISGLGAATADAAIQSLDTEFGLYLTNYGISRSDLSVPTSSSAGATSAP